MFMELCRINQKLFVKSAEFVAKCANDRLLTPIIRSNFVDDYVEQVARWVLLFFLFV